MDEQQQAKIYSIERPSSKLLTVYFLNSLATLLAFPVVFGTLFCKYITLRYKFEEEGVSASWGVLFRRQVYLTYARIQDIHVSRGLVERWLGIGTVDIQTASGSATAELSIAGMEEYETIRDFLYSKMRGYREERKRAAEETGSGEALELLNAIRDEMRGIRTALEQRGGGHV